jgi:hypothetical protein
VGVSHLGIGLSRFGKGGRCSGVVAPDVQNEAKLVLRLRETCVPFYRSLRCLKRVIEIAVCERDRRLADRLPLITGLIEVPERIFRLIVLIELSVRQSFEVLSFGRPVIGRLLDDDLILSGLEEFASILLSAKGKGTSGDKSKILRNSYSVRHERAPHENLTG